MRKLLFAAYAFSLLLGCSESNVPQQPAPNKVENVADVKGPQGETKHPAPPK
jgi:hypothetical protein